MRARLGERLLDGVASYGKPMFNNELPPFETFLFDFDADIYGRHLEVALIGHIRGQERFAGLDELIAAIARDSHEARVALGECGAFGDLDRTPRLLRLAAPPGQPRQNPFAAAPLSLKGRSTRRFFQPEILMTDTPKAAAETDYSVDPVPARDGISDARRAARSASRSG